MAEKLVVRVLAALREGYDNSRDIAEHVGVPANYIPQYLRELEACGLARITHRMGGRWLRKDGYKGGRTFMRWAAT